MRTLVLALLALSLLTLVPAPAQAQQTGSLVLVLNAPERALHGDDFVTVTGIATLTVDYTAVLAVSGIPVTYTVTKAPAWATVIVTPGSDVFPGPYAPMPGLAYSVTRAFSMTISVADGPGQNVVDTIEITAVTEAAPLGRSFTGKASVPVSFYAEEEACEVHDGELLALAREAANEYAAAKEDSVDVTAEAPRKDASEPELHAQSGSATTLSIPWIAVAGFALVGAGVGLVLRRRLGR